MTETVKENEIFYIDTETARCDGGGGPLGHPAVYINLGRVGEAMCSYCGRHYIKKSAS